MNDHSNFILTLYEYVGNDAHVTIPDGVTRIEDEAFSNNEDIESVHLPEGVESIGSCAFRGCTKLESINLPSTLTELENNAFDSCSSLKSIVLPEDFSSLESETFTGCSSLEEVTIPASLVSWSWDVFDDCDALRLFHVPAGSWVRQIPDVLGVDAVDENGMPLPALSVDDDDWSYTINNGEVTVTGRKSESAGTLFTEPDCATTLYIPSTIKGLPVSAIGKNAFYGDEHIDALYIPDGVRYIGARAFAECSTLAMIRLPESLKSMGGEAFDSCDNLSGEIDDLLSDIDGYFDPYNGDDAPADPDEDEDGLCSEDDYEDEDDSDDGDDPSPRPNGNNIIKFKPRDK